MGGFCSSHSDSAIGIPKEIEEKITEDVTAIRNSIQQKKMLEVQERTVFIIFGPPEYPTSNAAEYLKDHISIPLIHPCEYITELNGACETRVKTVENVTKRTLLRKSSSIAENPTRHALIDRIRQEDCCKGFILYEYPDTVTEMRYFQSNIVPHMRVELIFLKLDNEV
jgi:adenylate kinase family enzyme